MVSNISTMQLPIRTEPVVWLSNNPVSACCNRRKVDKINQIFCTLVGYYFIVQEPTGWPRSQP